MTAKGFWRRALGAGGAGALRGGAVFVVVFAAPLLMLEAASQVFGALPSASSDRFIYAGLGGFLDVVALALSWAAGAARGAQGAARRMGGFIWRWLLLATVWMALLLAFRLTLAPWTEATLSALGREPGLIGAIGQEIILMPMPFANLALWAGVCLVAGLYPAAALRGAPVTLREAWARLRGRRGALVGLWLMAFLLAMLYFMAAASFVSRHVLNMISLFQLEFLGSYIAIKMVYIMAPHLIMGFMGGTLAQAETETRFQDASDAFS